MGWEAPGTIGVTFNFENPSTNYTNGIDAHFDWGLSKFLTEQFFVGGAGYVYQQLTSDHGQLAVLGDFESHTMGIGPQVGYNFVVDGVPIYANLRGYYDVDTRDTLEKWPVEDRRPTPF